MTRHRVFALLGALVGVVVLVCAAIFTTFGSLGGSGGFWGSDGGPRSDSAAVRDSDGSRGPSAQARVPVGAAEPASADTWTGTWATAPVGAEQEAPTGYPGRSIRNVVHLSIGGTSARVTFSNLYSPKALFIGHASVAVHAGGAAAAPGTMRRLTFAHRENVTVPPGGQVISDPVRLRVADNSDLLVSLYTPVPGGPATYHTHAQQTSYFAEGDRTEELGSTAYTEPTTAWRYVTAVDVLNQKAKGTVVAFGDSITDGVGSTKDKDNRWPDVFARRVAGLQYGVVNEGIGGNQVLVDAVDTKNGASGINRFRRDVLDRAGAKTVVIDLGVNDILRGRQTDPSRITAGLKALTRQAHARGLRVIGSTLTPFGAHRGYTGVQESVREQVNAQIRAGGIYDAVVDFDKALRDPYAPTRLRPVYDSGDGLHPSDAGYTAMARTLNLNLLGDRTPATL
ncbi:SGNH/GDSL hydrolase family protein [Streptomyces sp. NPDC088725]|uniref:SGNH/GDSL hydrolase family protein n=1 Tax=Streptomyces sp. NPDC088725 TaxID=3365873 RepID=UPI00382AE69C